jgi:hypothetical protein
MEGYLNKRGRGDSSFGRKNWKKRWFILDEEVLEYYEELNLFNGTPINFKGAVEVGGCEIVTVDSEKCLFDVKHSERKTLHLQAPDAQLMLSTKQLKNKFNLYLNNKNPLKINKN